MCGPDNSGSTRNVCVRPEKEEKEKEKDFMCQVNNNKNRNTLTGCQGRYNPSMLATYDNYT